jgi:hypothetical protein
VKDSIQKQFLAKVIMTAVENIAEHVSLYSNESLFCLYCGIKELAN